MRGSKMSNTKYIDYNMPEIEAVLKKNAAMQNLGSDYVSTCIDFFKKCKASKYMMSNDTYNLMSQCSFSLNDIKIFINLKVYEVNSFDYSLFSLFYEIKANNIYKGKELGYLIQAFLQAVNKGITADMLQSFLANSPTIADLNSKIKDFDIEAYKSEVENDKSVDLVDTNSNDNNNSLSEKEIEQNEPDKEIVTRDEIKSLLDSTISDSFNRFNESFQSFQSHQEEKNTVKELEKENKDLRDKLIDERNKVLFYKETKNDLYSKNKELREALRGLKKELKESEKISDEYKHEKNKLEVKNKELEDKINQFDNIEFNPSEKSEDLLDDISVNEEYDEPDFVKEIIGSHNEMNSSTLDSIDLTQEETVQEDFNQEEKIEEQSVNYDFSNNYHSKIDDYIAENMSLNIDMGDGEYVEIEKVEKEEHSRLGFFKKIMDSFTFMKFKKMPTDEQKSFLFAMITKNDVYKENDNNKAKVILKIKELMDKKFDNVLIYQVIEQNYTIDMIDELLNYSDKDIKNLNDNPDNGLEIFNTNFEHSSIEISDINIDEEIVNDEEYDE